MHEFKVVKNLISKINTLPLLGFALWLTTIFGLNFYHVWWVCFGLTILRVFDLNLKNFAQDFRPQLLFLALITLLCFTNQLFGDYPLISQFPPQYLLNIVGLVMASILSQKDINMFMRLICLEFIILCFQFLLGINTVFTKHVDFRSGTWFYSIYSGRAFGLSSEISDMGVKLFLFFILYFFKTIKNISEPKKIDIWLVFASTALLINFHRTSLVAIGVFSLVYLVNFRKFYQLKSAFLGLTLYLLILLVRFSEHWQNFFGSKIMTSKFVASSDFIINSIYSSSAREKIFKVFFEFIKNNFWFGNHSFRLNLYVPELEYSFHAHNSFLQLIATHGVFIFCLYILYIKSFINLKNLIWTIPFFAFSMLQYGIFWGISLIDVMFLYILIQSRKTAIPT